MSFVLHVGDNEMSRVQLYYANCADQIQGLIDQEGA